MCTEQFKDKNVFSKHRRYYFLFTFRFYLYLNFTVVKQILEVILDAHEEMNSFLVNSKHGRDGGNVQ